MKRKRMNRLRANGGISFIEVMVALAVLSAGIVLIFKTYLVTLDQMSYLTTRVYASQALDNTIALVERKLIAYQALPYDIQKNYQVDLGHKTVVLDQKINISAVNDFSDIFQVDLSMSWQDKDRTINVTRSGYVTDALNPGG